METADAGFGALGVTATFADANVKPRDVPSDSRTSFDELEGGVYWRLMRGGLQLSARGAGGYVFGRNQRFVSLAATDATTAVALNSKSDFNGYTADARASASYQVRLGPIYVRPQLAAEYFRLDQDGYVETGGESATDLSVQSRTGHSASGTASVVFGTRFGEGLTWEPTLEVGARDVFSGDAGTTTARFTAGGDAFSLVANPITGVGGVVTAGLKLGGPIYQVFFDAHGEDYSRYREGDVRAGVKVVF